MRIDVVAETLPENRFDEWTRLLSESPAGSVYAYHAQLPDGRTAASQLVLLGPGPVAHSAAAAADPAFLRSGASAFLGWGVFKALSAAGYSANDLTDAGINPVTHFKSQLGGELRLNLLLDAPRSWLYRTRSRLAALARSLVSWRG